MKDTSKVVSKLDPEPDKNVLKFNKKRPKKGLLLLLYKQEKLYLRSQE